MLYHILSYEDSSLLKIDNIGFSDDAKICKFGPGQRDLYLIHYVISGKGSFNGVSLEAGQGFLIRPQDYEYYFPDIHNPWKLLWITSHDENINEIFKTYGADEKTQIFDYGYINKADELTGYIKNNHSKVFTPSKILEIFLNLYNHQTDKIQDREKMSDVYYNYALSFINSNIFKPISVNELTDILGVSQPYLYKVFINKCGNSPKQIIDKLKLQKAQKLLQSTSLSIADIACSVGYSDPLSFSKFFKKKVLLSPTEFRAQNADI